MAKNIYIKLSGFLLLGVMLVSCQGNSSSLEQPSRETAADSVMTETPQATSTPIPTQTPPPSLTPTPTITPTVVLEPDPISFSFSTEDGQELSGLFYPGSENPAPVILVFPWARGDQGDWNVIASWLQNRNFSAVEPGRHAWQSPIWFPERNQEQPLGVVTVDFRGCEGGCTGWLSSEWLLDAQAAAEAVTGLHGVNSQQVLTLGASIGADAAVHACQYINNQDLGTCRGSFDVSPGSFLTMPYQEAAAELQAGETPAQVWCVFARRDDAAWETCSSAAAAKQVDFGYVELHGMELFQPGLEIDLLQELQQFVADSLNGSGK